MALATGGWHGEPGGNRLGARGLGAGQARAMRRGWRTRRPPLLREPSASWRGRCNALWGNTPVHGGMGDARSGSPPPGEPRMIREPGWSGLAVGIPAPPGVLQERANKNTETDLEGDCWRQENAFYFSAVHDASWAHLTRRGWMRYFWNLLRVETQRWQNVLRHF